MNQSLENSLRGSYFNGKSTLQMFIEIESNIKQHFSIKFPTIDISLDNIAHASQGKDFEMTFEVSSSVSSEYIIQNVLYETLVYQDVKDASLVIFTDLAKETTRIIRNEGFYQTPDQYINPGLINVNQTIDVPDTEEININELKETLDKANEKIYDLEKWLYKAVERIKALEEERG